MGIDVGIIPTFIDNIQMRDQCERNGIRAETAKILRSQIIECDLHIRGLGPSVGPLTNMSRFLQNLEHCSGDNAEVSHNYWK